MMAVSILKYCQSVRHKKERKKKKSRDAQRVKSKQQGKKNLQQFKKKTISDEA